MGNYTRLRIAGGRVFFTVALAGRSSDALTMHVGALRGAVEATRAEMPWGIDAWVVLPDHLHAVWTLPQGDSDYSERWRRIKGRFSRAVGGSHRQSRSKIAKRETGLWQRRFWEHGIRDEVDYRAHIAYCWGNPVKHGLVARAIDWPYSSIHRDIRRGLVPSDWTGGLCDGDFGERPLEGA